MTWGFVAVGAATAVSTMMQGASASNASAAAGYKEVTAASRASIQQNMQIQANNESTLESNLKNTIRTGYQAGLLNVQRAQVNREALQKGFDISQTATNALGAATANQAAAGAIGASARAVLMDVRQRAGEAQAETLESWKVDQFNLNTQLAEIIYQGTSNLKKPQGATQLQADMPSDNMNGVIASGIVAGGLAMVSAYGTSQIKLNAGTGAKA